MSAIEKAYQATDNAELQTEVDALLTAIEAVSTATSIQEVPSIFQCLEESSLVKAIDTLVLVLTSHSTAEEDKKRKLR